MCVSIVLYKKVCAADRFLNYFTQYFFPFLGIGPEYVITARPQSPHMSSYSCSVKREGPSTYIYISEGSTYYNNSARVA